MSTKTAARATNLTQAVNNIPYKPWEDRLREMIVEELNSHKDEEEYGATALLQPILAPLMGEPACKEDDILNVLHALAAHFVQPVNLRTTPEEVQVFVLPALGALIQSVKVVRRYRGHLLDYAALYIFDHEIDFSAGALKRLREIYREP